MMIQRDSPMKMEHQALMERALDVAEQAAAQEMERVPRLSKLVKEQAALSAAFAAVRRLAPDMAEGVIRQIVRQVFLLRELDAGWDLLFGVSDSRTVDTNLTLCVRVVFEVGS